ncbi:uncharacterized protein LOC117643331 [Thrips palmi]|uniref:Uncharacterized protein LOC117643331 n=1 Tax=Thrips palmi TaxID=161013 RepID=A0A6P8YVC1_THRPL|nr:uncharacterized protein LOC117643331 [Thrips palmi]
MVSLMTTPESPESRKSSLWRAHHCRPARAHLVRRPWKILTRKTSHSQHLPFLHRRPIGWSEGSRSGTSHQLLPLLAPCSRHPLCPAATVTAHALTPAMTTAAVAPVWRRGNCQPPPYW